MKHIFGYAKNNLCKGMNRKFHNIYNIIDFEIGNATYIQGKTNDLIIVHFLFIKYCLHNKLQQMLELKKFIHCHYRLRTFKQKLRKTNIFKNSSTISNDFHIQENR